eukprot:8153407-Prorocentrum_lima.AAC.1
MNPAGHLGRIIITAQRDRNRAAVQELQDTIQAAGGEASGINWTTELFQPGRHAGMAGPGVVE